LNSGGFFEGDEFVEEFLIYGEKFLDVDEEIGEVLCRYALLRTERI
jgi:hypothetical protein